MDMKNRALCFALRNPPTGVAKTRVIVTFDFSG
jgi:hypothetical protein